MIVGDLLGLDGLHIGLAWGTSDLLDRQVTGVTSTDLQDPARYLQPGELVLSGLVWWQPDETSAALRFATSLRSAGVAALLAGEGTHGNVPESLVDACRTHEIPLLSVPPGTSFRAVTDRVYLRLWGGMQTRSEGVAVIPDAARRELLALLHAESPLDEVLARAVAGLGVPDCSVVSATGRVLARSTTGTGGVPSRSAGAVPSRSAVPIGPQGDSPFDGWLLQPHTAPTLSASTVLDGLAELLAPLATRVRAGAAAQRQTAARLIELLVQDGPGLADALSACGLPSGARLTPVTARIDGDTAPTPDASWAVAALAEALHRVDAPFAAAPDGHGGATALVKRQGWARAPLRRPGRCGAHWCRPRTRWRRAPTIPGRATPSAAAANSARWQPCCAASRPRSRRPSTPASSRRSPTTTGRTASRCWAPWASSSTTTAPGPARRRRSTST